MALKIREGDGGAVLTLPQTDRDFLTEKTCSWGSALGDWERWGLLRCQHNLVMVSQRAHMLACAAVSGCRSLTLIYVWWLCWEAEKGWRGATAVMVFCAQGGALWRRRLPLCLLPGPPAHEPRWFVSLGSPGVW